MGIVYMCIYLYVAYNKGYIYIKDTYLLIEKIRNQAMEHNSSMLIIKATLVAVAEHDI